MQEVLHQHVALTTDDCKIDGLSLIKDFVSEEEEQVGNQSYLWLLCDIAHACSW